MRLLWYLLCKTSPSEGGDWRLGAGEVGQKQCGLSVAAGGVYCGELAALLHTRLKPQRVDRDPGNHDSCAPSHFPDHNSRLSISTRRASPRARGDRLYGNMHLESIESSPLKARHNLGQYGLVPGASFGRLGSTCLLHNTLQLLSRSYLCNGQVILLKAADEGAGSRDSRSRLGRVLAGRT